VKLSHDVATHRLRIGILLLAAAAMLAALSFSVAQAGAASGSGGVSTGDDSAERSSKREAKYDRLWDEVSKRNKRWARKTAECESGKDPKAIGGGGKYRGAFQFLKSTWRRSPKSPGGDPIEYQYRTQAVVAVALKQRDGAHHWPVCG
jgi:Transglycosylase-like domain